MRFTKRRLLIYLAILLLAPLLTAAILLPTYPLREDDGEVSARLVMAWALEGRPLPGSPAVFGEAPFFSRTKHILLTCDWLPPDVALSTDPRVQRVTTRKGQELLESKGVGSNTYLVIHLKKASEYFLLLEVMPGVNTPERQFYEITFRRRLWGLEARVKVVGVP